MHSNAGNRIGDHRIGNPLVNRAPSKGVGVVWPGSGSQPRTWVVVHSQTNPVLANQIRRSDLRHRSDALERISNLVAPLAGFEPATIGLEVQW